MGKQGQRVAGEPTEVQMGPRSGMYNSGIPGSEGEMTASQLRMDMKNSGAGREVALRRIDKDMRPTHGTQN